MIRNESIRGAKAAMAVETPPAKDAATALVAGATEHMYMPTESLFGGVCNKIHARGWTVLPQERQGKRLPSRIDGQSLKWGEFIERMPTPEETQRWGIQARTANAAILLGSSSGNVWALDIDVLDEELSYAVQELATDILGPTNYRRQGMAPKMALFYRSESADDVPAYKNFRFVGDAGTGGREHGIEILGRGRLITCYGYHHKTSEYFRWYANQPLSNGPQDVPVATAAQLEAFIAAVQDLRAFYRPAPRTVQWIEGEGGDIVAGKLDMRSATAEWVQNEQGLVTDGRDNFLWSLTRATVRRNGTDILVGAVGEGDLLKSIRTAFRLAECQDAKRWSDRDLQAAAVDKITRAVSMLRDGKMKPQLIRTVQTEAGPVKKAAKPFRRPTIRPQDHDAFEFLGKNRASLPTTSWPITPEAVAERRLRMDRDAMGVEATAALEAGINAFLNDVMTGMDRTHVLDGPTGLGKSTMALKLAAVHDALFDVKTNPDGSGVGPLVFLLPQYRNVAELRARADLLGLDADATDDELIAAADDLGILSEKKTHDRLIEMRRFAMNSGLKAMIYAGKLRAGCLRKDEMKALTAASVPSSGLCSKQLPVRNSQGVVTDHEDVFCPFYATCPAIAQRAMIKDHHLVFLVRSFLTLSLPDELKSIRGLIIDEKFFDLLVHTRTMPLSSLDIGRREPKLTKIERDELKMSPFDILQSRSEAVEIAKKALREGKDLAETFRAYARPSITKDGKKAVTTGLMLVADARRVCGNAMTAQADIDPTMPAEEIIEMCARPAGTDIAIEFRFWKLVEDRLDEMQKDEMAGRDTPEDRRIALLKPDSDCPTIRVAWKTEANWSGVPKLLLDASTDSVLTELVLGSEKIVRHRVEVSLNMRLLAAVDRRLSMRKLFPGDNASPEQLTAAAELIAQIRCIISTVCMTHGHARVFVALPMKLRRAILLAWMPPFNADFGHNGAIAGIDAYRQHGACLAISRMEIAVQDIDGIVAALTYGTKYAEDAIDPRGTGEDEDGEKIYPNVQERFFKLRDGSLESLEVQQHAGEIARRVQAQAREEELRQILGRIRPVWRPETIPVFAVTEAIPDDLIVDEVCAFQDLAKRAGGLFWDAVRMSGGVVQADILAMVAPHYGDRAQYARWIKTFVDDVPSVRARYSEADIIREGGDIFSAYVAGLREEGRLLIVPFLKQLGWKGTLAVRKRCDCVMQPAEAAPEDDIAKFVVDEHEAEWAAMQSLYGVLKERGIWQPGDKHKDILKAAGEGDLLMSGVQMSFGAWMALPNLRNRWVLEGKDQTADAGLQSAEEERLERLEAIGF